MNLKELFGKQEDLDPELAKHIYEGGPFGKHLKHPLVFSIFYTGMENALLNAQLKQKKEYITQCIKDKHWPGVIAMYERAYRFDAFKSIEKELTDKEYWEILGSIWTDSENIWQYKKDLKRLFHPQGRDWACRGYMMDEEERKAFELLPDVLRIYRGCNALNRKGYSWTLDRDKAIWFAKRFYTKDSPAPLLLTADIEKIDTLAYFTGRNEKEIVLLPECIRNIRSEKIRG